MIIHLENKRDEFKAARFMDIYNTDCSHCRNFTNSCKETIEDRLIALATVFTAKQSEMTSRIMKTHLEKEIKGTHLRTCEIKLMAEREDLIAE